MSKKRRLGVVALAVALVLFLSYAGYGYYKFFHKSSSTKSPVQSAQDAQNAPVVVAFSDTFSKSQLTLDESNFTPTQPVVQAITYQNHSNATIASVPLTITNKAGALVTSPTGAQLTVFSCSEPWKSNAYPPTCPGTKAVVVASTKLTSAPIHATLDSMAPGSTKYLLVGVTVPKGTPAALAPGTVTVVVGATSK